VTASVLDLVDVSVSFGGIKALRNITLAVPDGHITGLIGPNGAGKTTLFNVISGFQSPDAGRVVYRGHDITRLAAYRRARLGFSRTFQTPGLVAHETVATNLLAAHHRDIGYHAAAPLTQPRRWRHRERDATDRAWALAVTHGLADHWEDRVEDLSFGVARFVELACTQAHPASLLLLDEPTTGLDPGEITRLGGLLDDCRQRGITTLVVAHDVRFVMTLCDLVHVLADGTLLFSGPPAAAQRDPAVIEAYLGRPG
jgi:branched-chain amino acid transport system ATP-binding protein